MVERKSFGLAFVLWLFLGSIGAHRIYIKDNAMTFLWYWLAVICTLTIILWIDLFQMKSMIEKQYDERRMKEAFFNQRS